MWKTGKHHLAFTATFSSQDSILDLHKVVVHCFMEMNLCSVASIALLVCHETKVSFPRSTKTETLKTGKHHHLAFFTTTPSQDSILDLTEVVVYCFMELHRSSAASIALLVFHEIKVSFPRSTKTEKPKNIIILPSSQLLPAQIPPQIWLKYLYTVSWRWIVVVQLLLPYLCAMRSK